ncbi:putative oxidoreductase [Trematosphaeria pertusa]|uniref:Putative oxidoreductase n=1 Tax=Trematosphaeria pertusa TaxID=390896 RepID=A0A6A6IF37_9PLEO|nr:putative oxidoreductase [Trematosphaeria pertusa]KAF2249195.1 putative oxidoreductase [Trematosphaeria pertusa]
MSPLQAPLRTALIGLSSSATTSWASTAHLPGLLTSAGRSKLPIVALLNSSVDAAQASIKTYGLPDSTKAFGSPDDLASDPDVDLVICNTRVDKHYETILPSVKAGKDVYVEWPIAANLNDIEELVHEAKKSGSRVAVGLQRRWAPPVVKMRELLQDPRLGQVLSADVRAFGGTNDREILPVGLKYFAQRDVGGNPITIGFGHVFDFVLSVLGELAPESVHTKMQLQRPDVRIRDPESGRIVDTIHSDVPDLLSLHGALQPSPQTATSATLSFLFRRGQPFPGTPSLSWTINCEYGEIRLVSPSGLALQASAYDEPVTIHIHWFEDDRVEDVKFEWSKEQEEVPIPARSVMRSLYAFADGKEEGDGWVSLEDAARRARQIEGFLAEWGKSQG